MNSADTDEKSAGVGGFRSMLLSAGFANFDRFVVGPLLVTLAATFDTSISAASDAATAYFVAYGLSQPFWGVASDRYGRVRVVRVALAVGAIASALSAAAPSLFALTLARALAGAAFGAVVPATITYIGDTVRVAARQSALADLLAVMAIGSAMATAVAGVVVDYTTWRVMFVAVAFASLIAFVRLSSVAEPSSDVANNALHPVRRVVMVLRSKWALLVMVLGMIEGALVLGTFSLLPAAIEQQGTSATSAGAIAAIYGVSVLTSTRLVKRVAGVPLVPLAIGGLALCMGLALPAVIDGVAPLVVTAILLGVAWAAFHSSLQAWMTTTVPLARATAIALMTSALFLGSGLGTAFGGQLLDDGRAATMFTIAAVMSVVLVTTTLITRRAYVSPADVA